MVKEGSPQCREVSAAFDMHKTNPEDSGVSQTESTQTGMINQRRPNAFAT